MTSTPIARRRPDPFNLSPPPTNAPDLAPSSHPAERVRARARNRHPSPPIESPFLDPKRMSTVALSASSGWLRHARVETYGACVLLGLFHRIFRMMTRSLLG